AEEGHRLYQNWLWLVLHVKHQSSTSERVARVRDRSATTNRVLVVVDLDTRQFADRKLKKSDVWKRLTVVLPFGHKPCERSVRCDAQVRRWLHQTIRTFLGCLVEDRDGCMISS